MIQHLLSGNALQKAAKHSSIVLNNIVSNFFWNVKAHRGQFPRIKRIFCAVASFCHCWCVNPLDPGLCRYPAGRLRPRVCRSQLDSGGGTFRGNDRDACSGFNRTACAASSGASAINKQDNNRSMAIAACRKRKTHLEIKQNPVKRLFYGISSGADEGT